MTPPVKEIMFAKPSPYLLGPDGSDGPTPKDLKASTFYWVYRHKFGGLKMRRCLNKI